VTSDEITEALMELFKRGAINVTYDENLEARFEITEEGQKAMESWKDK
jgi:predicted transcriptional regulator